MGKRLLCFKGASKIYVVEYRLVDAGNQRKIFEFRIFWGLIRFDSQH
jgi:hypothetical protein